MTGKVEVTQADREAAAAWVEAVHGEGFRKGHHHLYRGGKGDESQLVQAFARHRLTTSQSQAARIAELEAAATTLVAKLDMCQPHIDRVFGLNFTRSGSHYDGPQYGEELQALRQALRSSSNG